MPRRYRRYRSTRSLEDQLLRDLKREAEKLLKSLTTQFLNDLEQQATQTLTQLGTRNISGGSAGQFDISGSLTRIFSSGISYIFSRPRTRTTTQETQRSKDADYDFRLSRNQAMAEASRELARGEKNR